LCDFGEEGGGGGTSGGQKISGGSKKEICNEQLQAGGTFVME
jgi:hypothetical protein